MRKLINLYKRKIAVFAIVLMSINTFATTASVDGSSFITKSEFDSLMKEFNGQMDTYQAALNAKIDYAIANYISGSSSLSRITREIVLPNTVKRGVRGIGDKARIEYIYGVPTFKGMFMQSSFKTGVSATSSVMYIEYNGEPLDQDIYKQRKTVVDNIKDSATAGESTARWVGLFNDCTDQIISAQHSEQTTYQGYPADKWANSAWTIEDTNLITDTKLVNSGRQIYKLRSTYGNGTITNNGNIFSVTIQDIRHEYGKNVNPYVMCLADYDYDMFSNYDEDRNWCYDGDYMDNFKGETWNKLMVNTVQQVTSPNNLFYRAFGGSTNKMQINLYSYEPRQTGPKTNSKETNVVGGPGYTTMSSGNKTFYVPMVGFESKYLTSWKQIYDGNTNEVAEFEVTKHGTETGFSNRAVLSDEEGKYYIGLTGGFPLMKINKGEILKYNLRFVNKDNNYVVWFAKRPFNASGHPDDDSACLTNIKGLTKADNTNKGYVVLSGEGSFETVTAEEDYYLYLKWGINAQKKEDICGGSLHPYATGTIEYK